MAANTGLLGNMAIDQWVPNQFASMSSRLVMKNGILVMGASALAILIWSGGKVDLLVVLYSIDVFLTFALSLLGLCIYWLRHRDSEPRWLPRFALSGIGLTVTGGILGITLVEKLYEGDGSP